MLSLLPVDVLPVQADLTFPRFISGNESSSPRLARGPTFAAYKDCHEDAREAIEGNRKVIWL